MSKRGLSARAVTILNPGSNSSKILDLHGMRSQQPPESWVSGWWGRGQRTCASLSACPVLPTGPPQIHTVMGCTPQEGTGKAKLKHLNISLEQPKFLLGRKWWKKTHRQVGSGNLGLEGPSGDEVQLPVSRRYFYPKLSADTVKAALGLQPLGRGWIGLVLLVGLASLPLKGWWNTWGDDDILKDILKRYLKDLNCMQSQDSTLLIAR